MPFITEPTAHTTSSPQIRDVLFFFSSLNSFFSYAPRQIDRTHARPPAHAVPAPTNQPPHRTWHLDLCLYSWSGPDIVLHVFCTATCPPSLPAFLSRRLVSSLPRRFTTITTLLSTSSFAWPSTSFVRQAAREKETEKNKGRAPDQITIPYYHCIA